MFLVFTKKGTKDHKIVALIHLFRNVRDTPRSIQGDRDKYNVEHPHYSLHQVLPLSYMKLDFLPQNKPNLRIIDTESIAQAVWTNCDFDAPENIWFLRCWPDTISQCKNILV